MRVVYMAHQRLRAPIYCMGKKGNQIPEIIITWFKSITIFRGPESIVHNIPHVQFGYGEYFAQCSHCHWTLLLELNNVMVALSKVMPYSNTHTLVETIVSCIYWLIFVVGKLYEDFKCYYYFQSGVAICRVFLWEVYFEGPNRVWMALKTLILDIGSECVWYLRGRGLVLLLICYALK